VIYWFRADLLKGKDLDLNFTTYSSQFPQICPLFNFSQFKFSWVHLLPHLLWIHLLSHFPWVHLLSHSPSLPISSFIGELGQILSSLNLFVHCHISPSSLGWLVVLLLAQVQQLSIFLQAVGPTNSHPFFKFQGKFTPFMWVGMWSNLGPDFSFIENVFNIKHHNKLIVKLSTFGSF